MVFLPKKDGRVWRRRGHLRIRFPEPCLSRQLNGAAQVAQAHQTFHLNAVPRYVDRVTELLQQKLKQSQLLALKKELMVQKQQGALQEQAALEPKLDLLLEKTKELQKLVRRERETCHGECGPQFQQNETPLLPACLVLLSFRSKLTFPRGTTGAP